MSKISYKLVFQFFNQFYSIPFETGCRITSKGIYMKNKLKFSHKIIILYGFLLVIYIFLVGTPLFSQSYQKSES